MFIVFFLMMIGYGASQQEGGLQGFFQNLFTGMLNLVGLNPENYTIEDLLTKELPDFSWIGVDTEERAMKKLMEAGIPEELAKQILDPTVGTKLKTILEAEGIDLTQKVAKVNINDIMTDGVIRRLLTDDLQLAVTLRNAVERANSGNETDNPVAQALTARFEAALQDSNVQRAIMAKPASLKVIFEDADLRARTLASFDDLPPEIVTILRDATFIEGKIDYAALAVQLSADNPNYQTILATIKTGLPNEKQIELSLASFDALLSDKAALKKALVKLTEKLEGDAKTKALSQIDAQVDFFVANKEAFKTILGPEGIHLIMNMSDDGILRKITGMSHAESISAMIPYLDSLEIAGGDFAKRVLAGDDVEKAFASLDFSMLPDGEMRRLAVMSKFVSLGSDVADTSNLDQIVISLQKEMNPEMDKSRDAQTARLNQGVANFDFDTLTLNELQALFKSGENSQIGMSDIMAAANADHSHDPDAGNKDKLVNYFAAEKINEFSGKILR